MRTFSVASRRSLVNVVVHEIAHSWTGNLITCNTWVCLSTPKRTSFFFCHSLHCCIVSAQEHFWLNEGWTVYLERKAAKLLAPKGRGQNQMLLQAAIGNDGLKDAIRDNKPEYTKLTPLLVDQDPVRWQHGTGTLRRPPTLCTAHITISIIRRHSLLCWCCSPLLRLRFVSRPAGRTRCIQLYRTRRASNCSTISRFVFFLLHALRLLTHSLTD